MKEIEEIWIKYTEFKEHAEQYMFPTLIQLDLALTPLYNRLKENPNDSCRDFFLKTFKNEIFPFFGIEY